MARNGCAISKALRVPLTHQAKLQAVLAATSTTVEVSDFGGLYLQEPGIVQRYDRRHRNKNISLKNSDDAFDGTQFETSNQP